MRTRASRSKQWIIEDRHAEHPTGTSPRRNSVGLILAAYHKKTCLDLKKYRLRLQKSPTPVTSTRISRTVELCKVVDWRMWKKRKFWQLQLGQLRFHPCDSCSTLANNPEKAFHLILTNNGNITSSFTTLTNGPFSIASQCAAANFRDATPFG